MPKVEIYTTGLCPYCHRAKALLKKKGVAFVEYETDVEPGRRAEMIERAKGRRTVPQIFIDGDHIGGSDDLYDLDGAGGLDKKLGIAPAS